ncbi:MAG: hypothetical protein HY079_10330 [Elusimicrobia bacterium]|nr:hypothetical protein [Elusimicrobiota bacterium]
MRLALALALTAVAGVAYAQGQGFVAYQNQLLARPANADVNANCAGKKGGDYDACRVTRFFLSDFAAGRDQGFPPMADLAYAKTQAEQDALTKALFKYSR